MKIAILGATGHIAKGLISEFASKGGYELSLYARRPEAVTRFLAEQGLFGADIIVGDFGSFGSAHCDVIVNAIGAGDPKAVRSLGADILSVTEQFDDMAMDYLRAHPATRYIFLSSGAVYGDPDAGSKDQPGDAYGLAKCRAEKKHRAFADLCIFDIRVFGYFSRFIDLTGEFFMAELARAFTERRVFETNGGDMVRDYAVPFDLANLIHICIQTERRNIALDMYSRKPVGKFEMLSVVAKQLGLHHIVLGEGATEGPVERRNQYFSEERMAAELGYEPAFGSLDGVLSELKKIEKREEICS